MDSGRLGTGLVMWVSLRCKRWVNSVIINGITEINYRCNCIYTISALYTVKKKKKLRQLKNCMAISFSRFLSSLNLFLYKIKQQVEKTKKSAEAAFLKMLCWLNCLFFYSVLNY